MAMVISYWILVIGCFWIAVELNFTFSWWMNSTLPVSSNQMGYRPDRCGKTQEAFPDLPSTVTLYIGG